MISSNFHLWSFAWETFILVAVPSAIALLILSLLNRRRRGQSHGHGYEYGHSLRQGHGRGVRAHWTHSLLAFLVGLVPAASWLSWSAYDGAPTLPYAGAPNAFPQWQIAGCGVTILIGCVWLSFAAVRRHRAVAAAGVPLGNDTDYNVGRSDGSVATHNVGFAASRRAVWTAAGFATAMAFADSFGFNPQAGIGVVLSLVGIGLYALVINEVSTVAFTKFGR